MELLGSFETSELDASDDHVFHVTASESQFTILHSEISPEILHSDSSPPNLPPPILPLFSDNHLERTTSLPDMSPESIEKEANLLKSILKRVKTHSDLTCKGCFGEKGTKSKTAL
jgi:hypothetical protein